MKQLNRMMVLLLCAVFFLSGFLSIGISQARFVNAVTWRSVYVPTAVTVISDRLSEEGQTVVLSDWYLDSKTTFREFSISLRAENGTAEGKLTCKTEDSGIVTAVLDADDLFVDKAGETVTLALELTDAALELERETEISVIVRWTDEEDDTTLWAEFVCLLIPEVQETEPPTEPIIETEPPTEPVIETEPPTEPEVTEPPTEAETEAPAASENETEAPSEVQESEETEAGATDVATLSLASDETEQETTISTEETREQSAPTDAPAETTAPTDAPAETTAPTDAPAETTAPTDAPAETTAPTDAPAETTAPTDAPAETTAPTDAPEETSAPTEPEETEPEETEPEETEPEEPEPDAPVEIKEYTEIFAFTDWFGVQMDVPEGVSYLEVFCNGTEFPAGTKYRLGHNDELMLQSAQTITIPTDGRTELMLLFNMAEVNEEDKTENMEIMVTANSKGGKEFSNDSVQISATRQPLDLSAETDFPVISRNSILEIPSDWDTDALYCEVERLARTEEGGITWVEGEYGLTIELPQASETDVEPVFVVSNEEGIAPAGCYRITLQRTFEGMVISTVTMLFFIHY